MQIFPSIKKKENIYIYINDLYKECLYKKNIYKIIMGRINLLNYLLPIFKQKLFLKENDKEKVFLENL